MRRFFHCIARLTGHNGGSIDSRREGRYLMIGFRGIPVDAQPEVQRLREALKPFAAIDLTTNQSVDAMDVLRARRVLEGGE